MPLNMKNCIPLIALFILSACSNEAKEVKSSTTDSVPTNEKATEPKGNPLDTALYDRLQTHLANGDTTGRWPVKHDYPV